MVLLRRLLGECQVAIRVLSAAHSLAPRPSLFRLPSSGVTKLCQKQEAPALRENWRFSQVFQTLAWGLVAGAGFDAYMQIRLE